MSEMSTSSADAGPALALIKAAVRAQAAYTLAAPTARRKLNQNESPADLPEPLKRAILERMAAVSWHRYPPYTPGTITARLAARHGWLADGVLVGNGSNELIQATLMVALEPGDVVVAPAPTFTLYQLVTAVLGGRYLPVALAADFAYDVDTIIAVARRERAKVVVLNSPNNPTGSALPPGGVERVLAGTEGLVVCDEAYQEFGGPSAVDLLSASPRLVVMKTFSKAVGLAGLRFGYALAHPAVAREIFKAKLPYNVNALTLTAVDVMLDHVGDIDTRARAVVAERERLRARLEPLPGIKVFPSAANFLLVRFMSRPAKEIFRRLLDEFGILVRDVSSGAGLADCLRISVGTPDDNDAVVDALTRILS